MTSKCSADPAYGSAAFEHRPDEMLQTSERRGMRYVLQGLNARRNAAGGGGGAKAPPFHSNHIVTVSSVIKY
jgi:hypothetical protein